MKDNYTHIVMIVDRSGSMEPLAKETIMGYNSFLEDQKKEQGDATLFTVLFNHEYDVLHRNIDIKDVEPLTHEQYSPGGYTALYDAVGTAILAVGWNLKHKKEEDRPSKVIVVIMTDGEENSSKEYTHEQISQMIKHQTDKYNWKFIFLGANIDAKEVGKTLNIPVAAQYSASQTGTQCMYNAVTKTVSHYRSSGSVDESLLSDLEDK